MAGWKIVPFEHVVRFRGSGASGLPTSEWQDSGAYPVIGQGAQEIEGWTDRTDLLLSFPSGVVLYGGHTRRAKYVERPFVPGPNVKILEPVQGLDSRFLFHYLTHLPIESKGYADHFPLVRKASVPVPPEDEQRRIVAILDEAFEAIATAKANTETNLQNGREVFEASLQDTFGSAPEGIDSTTLGAVCRFVGGSQPPKSDFIAAPRAGYVRLIQIRDYKSDAKAVYIPRALARRFCTPDDVMIGRYGPPLFQILRGLDGAYNVALIKAAPDESVLSKGYLYYFLRHRDILNYIITSSARAAGQIGLNKKTIEPYPIYVPCLEAQAETVSRLEQLEAATEALVQSYELKLAALDELKKSLLHQAFTGQLTAKTTDKQLAEVA